MAIPNAEPGCRTYGFDEVLTVGCYLFHEIDSTYRLLCLTVNNTWVKPLNKTTPIFVIGRI